MDLDSLLARIKTAGSALTRTQLATLAVTFIVVVGLVAGSAYWVSAPTYAVLFTDMDAETASAIAAKLKAEKVTYQLDDGGRTIRVPSTRVDELRLDLAGQGLPGSGRIGFEIFDRTAFGVTDFLEHVNYRRALEGELARTIATIGEIASARVHIALGKPSLFAGQEQPAKASVVLKLRGNRPLPASTISAISGLVAASVESLRPESVVIIDNYGRPLTRGFDGSDEAGAGAAQIERQQQIERELSARVVSMIEPIVGADRVRVNVSARLHTDTQEETEERWDPTPIVRSHQSVVQASGPVAGAGGLAGSRGNLPPPADPAKASAASGPGAPAPAAAAAAAVQVPANTHTSETTNYEVSKVTRHRIQPRGEVARLSVAVLLDAAQKTRSPEDLQKIHDVVAAAVGLEPDRGDQLTVETIPFDAPPAQEPEAIPWWRQYAPQLFEAARIFAVLAIAALALFAVVRPTVQRALAVAGARAAEAVRQAPRTIEELEGEMDADLDAALPGRPAGESRKLPVLTRRLARLTKQEPENAARLIRTWLAEEER